MAQEISALTGPCPEAEPVANRIPILVWGAGGHARSVTAAIVSMGEFFVWAYLDESQTDGVAGVFLGRRVLTNREVLPELLQSGVVHAAIAFGDNQGRVKALRYAVSQGFRAPSIAHARAVLDPDARVGMGSVLLAGAIVGPGTKIGDGVILNSASSVDHDCTIHEGAHIAPGAVLGGHVSVGSCALIGIGATVRDHVNVGEHTVVGAGSVVLRDLPPRVVAFGIPARVQRNV